jgi:predicted AlkP superfamily phosphohydrolase/phosphomutase
MMIIANMNPRYEGGIVYEVGRFTTNNETLPFEQKAKIFERLASLNFLLEVEKKASIPGLAKKLLSKDLGGEGKLSFVDGRTPFSIEIRISEPSKIMATKELNALIEVLTAKHQSLIEPTLQQNISNVKFLTSEYERLKSKSDSLEFNSNFNSNISRGLQKQLLYFSLLDTRKQLNLAKLEMTFPRFVPSNSEGGVFIIHNQITRLFRYLVFGLVIGFLLVLFFVRNKNK